MKPIITTLALIMCLFSFSQNQKNFTFFKIDGTVVKVENRKFKRDHVLLTHTNGDKEKLLYCDFYRYEYDVRKTGISKEYLHKVQEMVVLEDGKKYLLPLIVEGKCNLYDSGSSVPMTVSTYNYYIKREGEKFAIKIGTTNLISKNFKSVALDYFSDCDVMEEKIKKRFNKKRKRLKEIVSFYNDNCQ
ncbi:hypothetical protein HNV10_05835 [Winogradskyella litoriviva]|uniref:Uncharacterized protein n=1 Tax=Winogradskyella litoriviva TaxID=1220182 RepID=A0ABX2E4U0_9FLAO|nr:hypothetical protein [Winogradskyella litoriviva]NRD22751.1 hypothetical protein [Winogradskyella litoriviva]